MDKNNFSTFLRNNINDRFWDNYIELVRNEMIPYQLMALNDEIDGAPKSYCLENFKKAAKAAGEKSIEMLHLKDLTKVTGYIRGGCTSIGMKKQYPTFIHEAAKEQDKITVSGGRLGLQITLSPDDLCRAAKAEYADIIK